MKIIPPLLIDSTRLTSSTAVESDYLAYSAGTTYAKAVITGLDPTTYSNAPTAVVTFDHKDYESLQPANTGHQPDISPTWWLPLGASNKYRMFQYTRNNASVGNSPFTVSVTPGKRIDCALFFGLVADSVTLTITTPGPVVQYPPTVANLKRRATTRAYEYCFGEFVNRESAFFPNLPPVSGATVTMTLTRAAGPASCEAMILGTASNFRGVKLGAESDAIDFSRADRNSFGDVELIAGKSVPKNSYQITLKKSDVDKMLLIRKTYAGKPLAIVGIDNSNDGYFNALAQIGFFKRMPIVIDYVQQSLCSIEFESL